MAEGQGFGTSDAPREIAVYTPKQVQAHNRRGDCWVILYGEIFDLSSYLQEHPGQDFPLQVAGAEGTALFASIHSSHTRRKLQSAAFRSRHFVGVVQPEDAGFAFDDPVHAEIQQGVEAHFRSVAGTVWARGGLYEQFVVYSKFILVMAMVLYTKYHSIQGCATLSVLHGVSMLFLIFQVTHGACHGELARHYPVWFERLSMVCHRFLGGTAWDWIEWHNVSHHQHTNSHRDLDTNRGSPFYRLHDEDPYWWYFAYQVVYIWFLYPLTHMLTFLQRKRRTALAQALAWNLASLGLAGRLCVDSLLIESLVFGFGFVMINHITHANDLAEYVHHPGKEVPWGEHQIRSSANWSMGNPLVFHLLGGINMQIEHHLFQSVHHTHYYAISRVVQRVCGKWDVPYVAFPGYLDALASHARLLRRFGSAPGTYTGPNRPQARRTDRPAQLLSSPAACAERLLLTRRSAGAPAA